MLNARCHQLPSHTRLNFRADSRFSFICGCRDAGAKNFGTDFCILCGAKNISSRQRVSSRLACRASGYMMLTQIARTCRFALCVIECRIAYLYAENTRSKPTRRQHHRTANKCCVYTRIYSDGGDTRHWRLFSALARKCKSLDRSVGARAVAPSAPNEDADEERSAARGRFYCYDLRHQSQMPRMEAYTKCEVASCAALGRDLKRHMYCGWNCFMLYTTYIACCDGYQVAISRAVFGARRMRFAFIFCAHRKRLIWCWWSATMTMYGRLRNARVNYAKLIRMSRYMGGERLIEVANAELLIYHQDM